MRRRWSEVLPREDYFVWPIGWSLRSCNSADPGHLRAPKSVGPKDPAGIRSLIVGLNPGAEELEDGRFFVGRAGKFLRSHDFDLLWDKAGSPKETLVTNIVKLSTPRESDLSPSETMTMCVRGCFLAEVCALPSLEQIFLLGQKAQGLFRTLVLPGLTDHRGLTIYDIRHPSLAWTLGPRLQKQLSRALRAEEGTLGGKELRAVRKGTRRSDAERCIHVSFKPP